MGEFSFPRLVVFCLLPVTYKRGQRQQRPFVSSPPDAASNSWRPRLDVHFSVSFLFFLFAGFLDVCKEGRGRGKPNSAPFFLFMVPVGYPRRRLSAVTPSFL